MAPGWNAPKGVENVHKQCAGNPMTGVIDFRLDSTMAGHSCHCFLSPFTGVGLSRDIQIMVTNLQNLHFLIVHY